ncbi:hypothetical protein T484DRAFT_1982124 [Baffinella frigidus]|nr:hypothetical protein T484DRAFT_1982124 [Cryptophyta sp. CCMP2293]|mmetsp:Transcript_56979/g.135332  ORF Transcript_56979/g.135332 Transcript_56979/m.135332 type:complete len:161 (+) Transcript_56979:53-535(+)|eukprot:CAMPEP_0180141824 /NCGR_PEP_ID=MMETSP0986-20121125/15172_1 /TAXON_ID=697907 /ORGANISM="non described non described, Strain CCMP2293" /LENGTH=160 /DNA_ID=CAMNT_0022084819 /DNA_START=47 /DNA_END=529 /DNA_ORIENTATION=+
MADERANLLHRSSRPKEASGADNDDAEHSRGCRFDGFLFLDSWIPQLFGCFYPVRGITLWPFIFLSEGCHDDQIINHERIHIHQANEMLVIGMYIVWVFDFLRGIVVFGDARTSYLHNRLEREAMMHEDDLSYLSKRRAFEWTRLSWGELDAPDADVVAP